jgi:hypothetical protein
MLIRSCIGVLALAILASSPTCAATGLLQMRVREVILCYRGVFSDDSTVFNPFFSTASATAPAQAR